MEVVGLHLYSAGSVIMLILIMCAVILLWRCCKRKNRQKIARFICIKRCRYAEDPSKTPERSVTYTKATGARVEDVPLNANGLVALANQLALNQAFSQVQSQSRHASTSDIVTKVAAESTANV